MLSAFSRAVEEVLLQHIRDRYQISYEKLNFTLPPSVDLGELALPIAFDLQSKTEASSSRYRDRNWRKPRERFPESGRLTLPAAVILTFTSTAAAWRFACKRVSDGVCTADSRQPVSDGKIIVEHTNINPNKAAHIGHLRNAALGDSFVRCLRFLGHDVEVQNYSTTPAFKWRTLSWGWSAWREEPGRGEPLWTGRFDYYCWDVYARVAAFLQGKSEDNRKWRS